MIYPEIQQQYQTITMQNKEYWLRLEDHLYCLTTFLLKLFNSLDYVLLLIQYYMNATLGNY